MKKTAGILLVSLMLAGFYLASCGNNTKPVDTTSVDTTATTLSPSLKEEDISYNEGSVTAKGYVVYDENKKGKRSGILVVHEWWGLNDYVKSRAKQLADLGYIAMAVDMYGDGKTASDPKEAMALAGPFYQNPVLTKTHLDAALDKLKTYGQTDTANIAAIGYCYGGFVVLNAAKQGADLKGVVVFHGNLSGAPVKKELLKAKVLVCNGGADKLVSEQETAAFKKSMDSVGADYTYKAYPGALHAYTNPASTENGKKFKMPIAYNAAADSASWNDMKAFFGKIFPAKL